MPRTTVAAAFIVSAVLASSADAAQFETLTLSDATELTYAIALPEGYDPSKAYPVLLALPPGPQTKAMVDAGLGSYWEAEGSIRGYIVVSPAAPNGELFFQGSEKYLPELMASIAQTYRVDGDRFDLAGVSNGGLSAFKVAVAHPEKFRSLTVVPGFPPSREVFAQLARIADIKVNMFVGEQDNGWVEPMNLTAEELRRAGNEVYLEIIPNNGHFVTSLSGSGAARIFDQIER